MPPLPLLLPLMEEREMESSGQFSPRPEKEEEGVTTVIHSGNHGVRTLQSPIFPSHLHYLSLLPPPPPPHITVTVDWALKPSPFLHSPFSRFHDKHTDINKCTANETYNTTVLPSVNTLIARECFVVPSTLIAHSLHHKIFNYNAHENKIKTSKIPHIT